MSSSDLDRAREMYDAWNDGNVDRMIEFWWDDATWEDAPEIPDRRIIRGRENVEANVVPIAGAEDFAFMLEKKPGAYIMIGNGGTGEGGCQNVHSPLYDFSDDILTTGAAYWVNLVQVELGDAAA